MLPANLGGTATRLLIVGGHPRSGTTFAQLLVSSFPEAATVNETHVLSQIVGPSLRSFDGFSERARTGRRNVGPNVVFQRGEFLRYYQRMVDDLRDRVLKRKPGASIAIEKTPENLLYWRELTSLRLGMAFLEVVRDPRDVFASLKAARRDWANDWSGIGAQNFAQRWCTFVRQGNALRDHPVRSHRLRYEALLGPNAPQALSTALQALGLDRGPAECRAALERLSISRMKSGVVDLPWDLGREPDGFFRNGRAGGWTEELTDPEIKAIEAVAGPTMISVGYELSGRKAVEPARAREPAHPDRPADSGRSGQARPAGQVQAGKPGSQNQMKRPARPGRPDRPGKPRTP